MLDGSKPDRSNTWKLNIIKKETPILDPIDKYTYWLVSKFTPIVKEARLIPERHGKMIVGDEIIEQEKGVLTKILYNRKVVLVWDFIEMGKVKREIALRQKI